MTVADAPYCADRRADAAGPNPQWWIRVSERVRVHVTEKNPRPVIDEPELGQHPAALTVLSEVLRTASDERQVVVATQSADLVSEFDPEDVVVVDRKDGASVFRRLDGDDLRDWLEDYALGELWKMNVIGGRPAS